LMRDWWHDSFSSSTGLMLHGSYWWPQEFFSNLFK
jgi:hypothetical protein